MNTDVVFTSGTELLGANFLGVLNLLRVVLEAEENSETHLQKVVYDRFVHI